MPAPAFLKNNWFNLLTAGLLIVTFVYNSGYDKKDIEDKPSKNEVKTMIVEELQKGYIEINRVSGLKEKIESMERELGETKALTQKILELLLRGK
jgi:wobble nucleotide-excising tRNase